MRNQRIERNYETKNHPSNSIRPSHFLHKSTVGGVGGISLPLSLGIVATGISLDNNEDAPEGLGLVVEGTKNAAIASLETRFEVSREFDATIYVAGSQADGPMGSELGRTP